MDTDFERELSELLHAVAPEPPDSLAPPRVAALAQASRADAAATVIEISPATGYTGRRRRRWPTVAAAAAVAALGAGVVAVTQIGFTDHHPATSQPTGTNQAPTVPQCRNNQVVVGQGRHGFATHNHLGTAQLSYGNRWATPCGLAFPTVAIGTESTGGTQFPANSETVSIPGHGQLVITAHVRVTGQCQTAADGLRINAIDGPFTYSYWLGVTGCTLTPLRLTHQVIG
ncbi:MAG: hypothetical protein QOI25_1001 [Mycobacterium sp.]|jgi:hypothetical protein|nr:hypothetical protein [Mycobacterium sp.]